jgi:diadenosine tetraphosphate (Ap4A) HIT family hydrolase
VTQVSSCSANSWTCALCSSIAQPRDPWDQPVFESENFIAIPSLGSLVEGWLLVVPRQHFISTGALTPDLHEEFATFKQDVAARLSMVYGDICAFEHGPCAPRRQVGCGVDHAHVHLVPLGFDLGNAATAFVPGVAWQPASWSECNRVVAQELDYLFVEQPLGSGRIAVANQFGSQVLRRAIASSLGRPEEFNWRTHRQELNIEKTIDRFSSTAVVGV